MTFPSRDRNSDKYPDRIFYQGRWRTPAQVETRRAISRRTDLRRGPARDSLRIRVFGGRYRLPNSETRELAFHLREERKEATRGR